MEEEEQANVKKRTKQTIGVSLEAYELIKSMAGPDNKYKTRKEAASSLILSPGLAVKELTIEKEEADKRVDWLQADVEQLTEREKTLVQEGRHARAALGALEDKHGLVKFILGLSYVLFGIVVVVYYIISA
jgi:FtsZ-binding cell division protein ZapB